jgi:hypothetical protein
VDDVSVRARCVSCGRGLGFAEWSRGLDRCPYCTSVRHRRRGPARPVPPRPQPPAVDYDELLDEIPGELVDELVAMLEAEVERRPELAAKMAGTPSNAFKEVADEVGFGRSAREFQWAAWGFVGGFGLNIALAKYAQMTTQAAMGEFLAPMLLGGFAAGFACAAIGWGAAKLGEKKGREA